MGISDHGSTYMRVERDHGELRPWHFIYEVDEELRPWRYINVYMKLKPPLPQNAGRYFQGNPNSVPIFFAAPSLFLSLSLSLSVPLSLSLSLSLPFSLSLSTRHRVTLSFDPLPTLSYYLLILKGTNSLNSKP